MASYTNMTGVPLSVAVYLATDNYDYDASAISATSLIKPLRQLVLSARVPAGKDAVDILSVVKSRTGSAIHDGIERAWKGNYHQAMELLGYPQEIRDRIKINPDPKTLTMHDIPVYMELRSSRVIDGQKISGKFDFVAEGRVEDFKTTTVFTWINDTKTDDYKLQGSIYRWLNPDIITEDHMAIQFIFTDWSPGRSSEPSYPNRITEQKLIPLMSLQDTEEYIRHRLATIRHMRNLPQEELPQCTDAELWRREPAYKYYRDPTKRVRSTRNFDDAASAYAYKANEGKGEGIVVEVPGEAVACRYCKAFPVCTQKDDLIANGSLKLQ